VHVDVRPLTADGLDDLADLFGTSGTTAGCYCAFFLVTSGEFNAGWRGGNRKTFEALVSTTDEPAGLLAYHDGSPVGWCATGPRDRYRRVLRSPLWRDRDASEDDSVWLVPCFYVRRSARGAGVTKALLLAAVDLAARHGAPAIEGLPRSGHQRVDAASAYVGSEALFADCGFTTERHPSNHRVLMRREISRRRTSGPGRGAQRGQ
jgi:GNAT superfamily N-acetyltransferase